ncbi:unnamed protein product [Cercopithifilaria johnstoni]|uniref:Uncharacterized protein n=1 Tax=Cercopithifilaria johnstoni TaxID=2874296 RepID=A0A8J2MF36_9BILA|nr:unnamed protein product [Cercopithifilaria johnstoni]
MSKSNLHIINGSPKSEIIRLREHLDTEAETDDADTYSPSISSFDENFNCREMFIITIDDDPHIITTNSSLSNSDVINSDRNQFAENIPARSISCVVDNDLRQTIKTVCFALFSFRFHSLIL